MHVAQRALDIARGGLQRRGMSEACYLDKLDVMAGSGWNQADELTLLYNTKWNQNVRPAFEYMAL